MPSNKNILTGQSTTILPLPLPLPLPEPGLVEGAPHGLFGKEKQPLPTVSSPITYLAQVTTAEAEYSAIAATQRSTGVLSVDTRQYPQVVEFTLTTVFLSVTTAIQRLPIL